MPKNKKAVIGTPGLVTANVINSSAVPKAVRGKGGKAAASVGGMSALSLAPAPKQPRVLPPIKSRMARKTREALPPHHLIPLQGAAENDPRLIKAVFDEPAALADLGIPIVQVQREDNRGGGTLDEILNLQRASKNRDIEFISAGEDARSEASPFDHKDAVIPNPKLPQEPQSTEQQIGTRPWQWSGLHNALQDGKISSMDFKNIVNKAHAVGAEPDEWFQQNYKEPLRL